MCVSHYTCNFILCKNITWENYVFKHSQKCIPMGKTLKENLHGTSDAKQNFKSAVPEYDLAHSGKVKIS